MKIEIQVEGGKVSITVGGQAVSAGAADGKTKQQGIVGGSGATEGTTTGGGAPGSGSGATLVIGPIVVDCCAPGENKGGGSKGGSGATEGTTTGGGGPSSSGVVVIGPIVVGGGYGGASKDGKNTPSQPIAVDPDE